MFGVPGPRPKNFCISRYKQVYIHAQEHSRMGIKNKPNRIIVTMFINRTYQNKELKILNFDGAILQGWKDKNYYFKVLRNVNQFNQDVIKLIYFRDIPITPW